MSEADHDSPPENAPDKVTFLTLFSVMFVVAAAGIKMDKQKGRGR